MPDTSFQKPTVVVTSISGPNPVMKDIAEGCLKHDYRFVIIGDAKSPPDFQLDGAEFFDLSRQAELGFGMHDLCPINHYTRKNLGYLEAIREGAEVILETDDDNYPLESFWNTPGKESSAPLIRKDGWINIYQYYSEEIIWPRGFPLDLILSEKTDVASMAPEPITSPIQQGVADKNPDVDAIYRLTRTLPVDMKDPGPIALAPGTWCPFNSQNTTWYPEAFPLLYLPAFCSFRMTDILRSFVAQRVCHANGWAILFFGVNVWQDRNEHNLMKDFRDEIPGYLQNGEIRERLTALDLPAGVEHVAGNMKQCYSCLAEMGAVGEDEAKLLDAWLNDMTTLLANQ